ncbi:MAG: acyltransferase [Candidatus Sulfotelmatobacter sp.]
MPEVNGHTSLYIGDNVRFSGSITIVSGRFRDHPTVRIGNRVFIGHNVHIACNQEVIVEDDVLIAGNCKISDYDGHPTNTEKRIAGCDPDAEDIRPVRISKGAWIGFGALILKGVTVGEGSVVGANSVVTHNVPPHCVVAGAPAKVVKQTKAQNYTSVAETIPVARYAASA